MPADRDQLLRRSERPMRVIVCGSRDWGDGGAIHTALSGLPGEHREITIVHGVCSRKVGGIQRSADMLADFYARELGFDVERHPADWDRYGKAAGVIRNQKMAELGADLLIAFQRDGSSGTADMILQAQQRDIPVEVHCV
jgi:hypothetical protein